MKLSSVLLIVGAAPLVLAAYTILGIEAYSALTERPIYSTAVFIVSLCLVIGVLMKIEEEV